MLLPQAGRGPGGEGSGGHIEEKAHMHRITDIEVEDADDEPMTRNQQD